MLRAALRVVFFFPLPSKSLSLKQPVQGTTIIPSVSWKGDTGGGGQHWPTLETYRGLPVKAGISPGKGFGELGRMDLSSWDEMWAALSLSCTRRGGLSATGIDRNRENKRGGNATEEELGMKPQARRYSSAEGSTVWATSCPGHPLYNSWLV